MKRAKPSKRVRKPSFTNIERRRACGPEEMNDDKTTQENKNDGKRQLHKLRERERERD